MTTTRHPHRYHYGAPTDAWHDDVLAMWGSAEEALVEALYNAPEYVRWLWDQATAKQTHATAMARTRNWAGRIDADDDAAHAWRLAHAALYDATGVDYTELHRAAARAAGHTMRDPAPF